MADSERPSPFTIPGPTFEFVAGPPSEPRPSRSMTVGRLIHTLTVFADFYERASADIDREQGVTNRRLIAQRDANADAVQRDFRAIVAIDRVRAYVLAKYGADLTIGTARRLLGDLINTCRLAVDAVEALPLEAAMDKLETPAPAPESLPSCPGCGSPPAATDVDDICPSCGAYTFLCGIIEHVPLGDAPVIKQQVTKPRWKRIPPSQVRTKQPISGPPSNRMDVAKPDTPAPAVAPEPAPKRSTERGEGRAKQAEEKSPHSSEQPSKKREPSKNAIAVYRYHFATGKNQTELANDLTLMELLGRAVDQGTISRWLTQVKEWLASGNVLPAISEEPRQNAKPMDPTTIDLGERLDRKTKRQRHKSDDK